MRSMVEGHVPQAQLREVRIGRGCPSTSLRLVPLPRWGELVTSAPVMWMRGGTSKGGYFLASDLPADTAARDAFLLR